MMVDANNKDQFIIKVSNVSKTFRKGQFLNPSGITSILLDHFLSAFKFKRYRDKSFRYEKFLALNKVSFNVNKGERIGFMGLNGAGKSTLLKILCKIMEPTSGNVSTKGRIVPLLGVGAGFDQELSGKENIWIYGKVLGLNSNEIKTVIDDIIDFSEISAFIDTPVKRYSKGMRARLGMSIAFHVKPDILIIDEVLAVGDIPFRAKCMEKISEITEKGVSLIFVSHSVSRISATTERCIILRKGEIVFDGTTDNALDFYKNNDLKLMGNSEIDVDDEDLPANEIVLLNKQKFDLRQNLVVNILDLIVEGSETKDGPEYFLDEDIFFTMTLMFMSDENLIVYPRIKFISEKDEFLFSVVWPDGEVGVECLGKGIVKVKMQVPMKILMPGIYKIGLGIFTYFPFKKIINERTSVAIKINSNFVEPQNIEFVSPLKRQGIIRPSFEWEAEKIERKISN